MRVALFVTCVNDAIYSETGKAVVAVRESLGHEVVFPADQTCKAASRSSREVGRSLSNKA
ncbi:MAG TPA: heterodisulfide reductase-related iron-sulfur binding cluster [Acidimicrobiales bacterium]|nr:heterodisulfide reductase-related iron-sulfur binding cluster [Acidimicrobiales bacterium]